MGHLTIESFAPILKKSKTKRQTHIMNRTFTDSQSSMVASLNLTQLPIVEMAFQSNPEKTYTFSATDSFGQELVQFIGGEQLPGSLGKLIASARSSGKLTEVAV